MLKEILYILFKGIYQVKKGSYTNSSYYRRLKNLGLFDLCKSKIIHKNEVLPSRSNYACIFTKILYDVICFVEFDSNMHN